ncbi:hypothetical protein C486_10539 [Natrinema gari JCM 14663]|uniref:Uncharacterized protein n=1 Tax=Natrinema gari JCM 14663 TaxID=1230459 RepID=L9Z2P5_9EURY|nr:hypothetical protein C486_10539 [Natrinema gari JCM 14663]
MPNSAPNWESVSAVSGSERVRRRGLAETRDGETAAFVERVCVVRVGGFRTRAPISVDPASISADPAATRVRVPRPLADPTDGDASAGAAEAASAAGPAIDLVVVSLPRQSRERGRETAPSFRSDGDLLEEGR